MGLTPLIEEMVSLIQWKRYLLEEQQMKNRNYFIRLIQRIISMRAIFLFLHGTQDQVVPILGAMHFAAKIVQATDEAHVRFQARGRSTP